MNDLLDPIKHPVCSKALAVYVYIYVYMYMYAYIYTVYLFMLGIYVYVHVYVCIYTHIHIQMCNTYIYIYMYTKSCVCVSIYMFIQSCSIILLKHVGISCCGISELREPAFALWFGECTHSCAFLRECYECICGGSLNIYHAPQRMPYLL